MITEVHGKNNMLDVALEDANRVLKFYVTKEKFLIEGEFMPSPVGLEFFLFVCLFLIYLAFSLQCVFVDMWSPCGACFGVCLPLLVLWPNDSPYLVFP